MLERAEERLGAAGYRRYEISSYARPGCEALHNQRYWQRRPVLGLGMGAVSNDPPSRAGRTACAAPTRARSTPISPSPRAGSAPRWRRSTPRAARGEAVFLALRTSVGLDAERFAREFGAPPRAFFADAIDALRAQGLLEEADTGRLGSRPAGGCSPTRCSRTSSDSELAVTWRPCRRTDRRQGLRMAKRSDSRSASRTCCARRSAPTWARRRRSARSTSRTCCSKKLSSATIRTTLAELGELGLVQQPHTSAGRVPTEQGLRTFIDRLLDRRDVAEYDRRAIEYHVDNAHSDAVVEVAAQLLSEQTRLLGFAVAPRLERVTLQHVSLVRLATGRVLAVLVSTTGTAYRRVIDADAELDQRELDRAASLLTERAVGRTLAEVRDALRREAAALRGEADRMLRAALELGARAVEPQSEEVDVVVATRLALLDQPEFRDPRRIRELLEALETKERLVEILDEMLAEGGVQVALGGEMGDPALSHCALVATRYGGASPLGAVGVIGPSRMDYSRVIPLVAFCSRVLTEKLQA